MTPLGEDVNPQKLYELQAELDAYQRLLRAGGGRVLQDLLQAQETRRATTRP